MEAEALNAAPSPYSFHDESPQSPSTPQTPTETAYFDYKPSALINESEEDYVTEDDNLLAIDPAPSGRTSISSFPASIIHHDISQDGHQTPPRSNIGTPTSYSHITGAISSLATRDHMAGFRNPSSVRALQMRDEDSDGEDFTPGHRRRGSRMSYMSYRSGSVHSTPGKRLSRSLQGSPVKGASKLRKEFPLVLLHCTLLPGLISPKAKMISGETLEAIIPEPYKKRWKTLQERVVDNSEVRDRGVLIPHPKEDYDMLEERLLESLELESPRINGGHYVGRSESRASVADSGFGSEETSSWGDCPEKEDRDKCTDCGQRICGEKKWELKVYAANGLMRAGAWAAAWSEMEKVDVQVSLSIPEDIRLEIEARLDAVILQEQEIREQERQSKSQAVDARKREIYGEPRRQEEIDGLDDMPQRPQPSPREQVQDHPPRERREHRREKKAVGGASAQQPMPKADLPDVLLNYVRLLAQDRRNIAIALLSLLVIFYAMANQQNLPVVNETAVQNAVDSLQETKIEYLTTTVISTSIALQTSTVTETTIATETKLALASASAQTSSSEALEVSSSLAGESYSPTTATSIEKLSESTPASASTSLASTEGIAVETETQSASSSSHTSTQAHEATRFDVSAQPVQTSAATSFFQLSESETSVVDKLSLEPTLDHEPIIASEAQTSSSPLERAPDEPSDDISISGRTEL